MAWSFDFGMRRAGQLPRRGAQVTSPGRSVPAVAATDQGVLRVSRTCLIRLQELQWRFSASGGPGGQHANTANTRAEVRFDVARSPSLGPRQRSRLLERLGPAVRVVASDERSQARNRQLALDRLRTRLADALRVVPDRHPTVPSPASEERRVDDKRRRGALKRQRGLAALRDLRDEQ